jgi:hypothetical protein
MNISFDLDGTLITGGNEFETEKRSFIARWVGIEKIRKGAPFLISKLQKKGHVVHIYTTSYRSNRKIRLTLKYYGVKVNKIINQFENEKVLDSQKIHSSKHPPSFGFDIHIDDLKGVGMEGEKYDFNTIVISPDEKNWDEKILFEIENFLKSNDKTTNRIFYE